MSMTADTPPMYEMDTPLDRAFAIRRAIPKARSVVIDAFSQEDAGVKGPPAIKRIVDALNDLRRQEQGAPQGHVLPLVVLVVGPAFKTTTQGYIARELRGLGLEAIQGSETGSYVIPSGISILSIAVRTVPPRLVWTLALLVVADDAGEDENDAPADS